MAHVEEVQRSPSRSQAVPVFLLSLGFAIAGTALLASIADAANWCCVHSWALVHGTGLIVLLFFGLIGFHLVRVVGERFGLLTRPPRSGWSWLPHVAYIAGALGSFYLTENLMWPGLIAGLAAVWLRARGRAIPSFGLAIVGLLVSVLCVASWLYS